VNNQGQGRYPGGRFSKKITVMKWNRVATWLLLLTAWAALAVWQLSEYNRLRQLAFDELHRQAETVNRALLGGIRTHRRMGRYFEENLQAALNDVVESEFVLAAAVESDDGKRIAFAGEEKLLDADKQSERGAGVFAFHDTFKLQPPADGALGGRGLGGYGRGAGWFGGEPGTETPVPSSATFRTVLLLDATPTETRCRREARLRGLVVAAGCLGLLCVALAWRATVRAAEAHGRARLFESETRYLRDLSQAAAGLAHETRNPLGLIRGWTQRLAERWPDRPELDEQTQAIVEECDRVTARINQFLAFARPAEPRIEKIAVGEVVDELAALLEPVLEAKDLSLDRHALGSDDTIQADRELFRQALFNLIQNAAQFSPQGGTIEMALRGGLGRQKRIEVSDRGPGVPEGAVESLFTPYFTSRPDGTGLGLAIVRRIAMAHGWQTGYTPRPGGGSVFWLDQLDG
jgi:signal transduction histidine kinase